jgi:hypothetical protein
MKIGDKVRFTNDGGFSAPTGSTARVVGTNGPWIIVKWIDKGDSGQMDGSYYPEHFEVIEEAQNNKTVMSKQILTVSIINVLEIHSIACINWKETIAKYLSRVDSDQEITFDQEEVDAMFKAATISQLPVLERIFGLQHKELTLKDIANGQPLFREDAMGYGKAGMIEVRAEDEYKDKAFWLSHLYNWEIKTDSGSMLVLIPTPKN